MSSHHEVNHYFPPQYLEAAQAFTELCKEATKTLQLMNEMQATTEQRDD